MMVNKQFDDLCSRGLNLYHWRNHFFKIFSGVGKDIFDEKEWYNKINIFCKNKPILPPMNNYSIRKHTIHVMKTNLKYCQMTYNWCQLGRQFHLLVRGLQVPFQTRVSSDHLSSMGSGSGSGSSSSSRKAQILINGYGEGMRLWFPPRILQLINIICFLGARMSIYPRDNMDFSSKNWNMEIGKKT